MNTRRRFGTSIWTARDTVVSRAVDKVWRSEDATLSGQTTRIYKVTHD